MVRKPQVEFGPLYPEFGTQLLLGPDMIRDYCGGPAYYNSGYVSYRKNHSNLRILFPVSTDITTIRGRDWPMIWGGGTSYLPPG